MHLARIRCKVISSDCFATCRADWTPLCCVLVAAFCLQGCRGSGRTPAPVQPAGTTRPASVIQDTRTHFYRAIDRDVDALRECERLTAGADETTPVLLAYRGACEMLRSAAAALPWDKGRHAKAGLGMLDRSVAAAPEDLEVRFVRGMTSYHLPAFFGRSKVAADDLSTVADAAEAALADGRLTPTLAAAALFHHGELLSRQGDARAARAAWSRAAAVGPATRAGRAALEKLEGTRS